MGGKDKGAMTVREAGHKGGETTRQRYGEVYEEIGRKGGQKVRELINRGKAAMGESKTTSKSIARKK
jgi:uncharacterized protein